MRDGVDAVRLHQLRHSSQYSAKICGTLLPPCKSARGKLALNPVHGGQNVIVRPRAHRFKFPLVPVRLGKLHAGQHRQAIGIAVLHAVQRIK